MDTDQTAQDNQVLAAWAEIKTVVDNIELDAAKNAKGVAAAGVRFRKGLRDLKNKAAALVKATVELDKAKKASKKAQ
jgi:hypothetical protein